MERRVSFSKKEGLVFTGDTLYRALQYWGPILGGFTIVIRAYSGFKANVSGWADTLLKNHLTHIQEATTATVHETQETNKLLSAHNEKEMAVWQGVVNTLAVLEDRTRQSTRSPKRRRNAKR